MEQTVWTAVLGLHGGVSHSGAVEQAALISVTLNIHVIMLCNSASEKFRVNTGQMFCLYDVT